jgi:uncharacterized protein
MDASTFRILSEVEGRSVGEDWMPATGVHALVMEDPALLWLKFHGKQFGFEQDDPTYSFLTFIGEKGKQFEQKWIKEVAPCAQIGCDQPWEVRQGDSLKRTVELLLKRSPVIYQGALWSSEERIYGIPDLMVLNSWFYNTFPHLKPDILEEEHYFVLDLKFTSKLDSTEKKKDLMGYATQVRLYSYMLGQIQGVMPKHAYLITRDNPFNPLPIPITSCVWAPLDSDLARYRDWYVDIKVNGASYLPWRDEIVKPNFDNSHDEPWHKAKRIIAKEKIEGRALELLYFISRPKAVQLKEFGYLSLDSLIAEDIKKLPLGTTKASCCQRAILQANQTGRATPIFSYQLPPPKRIELFVDFEFFTNVNVRFERQWSTMEGCEMVFMIGLGWIEKGQWKHQILVAEKEAHEAEAWLFQDFIDAIQERGVLANPSEAALYHWSQAEVWQTKKVAERLSSPLSEVLYHLPWADLQKPFLDIPIGIPGALTYKLKDIGKALSAIDAEFGSLWGEELEEGLKAMVMGWEMYKIPDPTSSPERPILCRYLESDILNLWQILRWLRQGASS